MSLERVDSIEKNGFENIEHAGYNSWRVDPKQSLAKRILHSFTKRETGPLKSSLSRYEVALYGSGNVSLKKVFTPLQIQMIALGGTLGAGLFITTGRILYLSGPAGLIISFGVIGLIAVLTMAAASELSVQFPVTGAFSAHASRLVDYSWGFAAGWLYAVQWLLVCPCEIAGASIQVRYWYVDTNKNWVPLRRGISVLFSVIVAITHLIGPSVFGTVEAFAASVKLLSIVAFLIWGIVEASGGGPSNVAMGAVFWHTPGPFAGGFHSICQTFVASAWTMSGVEFCALAAAEAEHPQHIIQRCTRQVVWRVVVFVMGCAIIIGLLVASNDPILSVYSRWATPFVLAIRRSGSLAWASAFNVLVIITSMASANSAVYASTRTLVSLAAQGHAPQQLAYVDRCGRPLVALGVAFLVSFMSLIPSSGTITVYTWLSNFIGMSCLITWLSICITHIRFRLALRAQAISLSELLYKSAPGIWGSLLASTMIVVCMGLQFWTALFVQSDDEPVRANAKHFFLVYLGVVLFVVILVAHKIVFRDKIPALHNIDLIEGSRFADMQFYQLAKAKEDEIIGQSPVYYRLYRFLC